MNVEAGKPYDGFVQAAENRNVPFHFDNGILELYLGNAPCMLNEGTSFLIGQKRGMMAGGYVLFHFSLPLENYGTLSTGDETGAPQQKPITIGIDRKEVDFFIDGYEDNSQFTKMKFSFPELDYFIPSSKMCELTDENVLFARTPEIISRLEFLYKEQPVIFLFRLNIDGNRGTKGTAETTSELLLEFAATDDMEFLLGLYHIVYNLFSFLCNRQNIALDGATLKGTCICKGLIEKDGKRDVGDKEKPTSQTFFVMNKYKETLEDEKRISKTIRYGLVAPAFEGLIRLFLDHKVSVFSVHSSIATRNLLDLKQCLQITAAFEHYQRNFLPEISSETTLEVYEEVKELIQKYVDAQTGEKKKKSKRLLKSLAPVVSLQDKICKTYLGYGHWQGVKSILSGYFGEDVTDLANVANEWRNELAHEKRVFEPDERVISSIRLVEHLNYCIVLRAAGYSDDCIKSIIEEILTR